MKNGEKSMIIDKPKQIDYRFKILYAIAIMMVCFGHTGGGVDLFSDWFPYGGLHLPIFVFSSGYFYRESSEYHVSSYILKKTKRLILPFYAYNIVYGCIVQILKLFGFEIGGQLSFSNIFISPILHGHQFVYNLGGWFVIPLFMVEIVNIVVRKQLRICKIEAPEELLFILSIILGIFGNQLSIWGYNTNWWLPLVRMLYFIPFYELGIFFYKRLEKYESRVPCFYLFAGIFFIKFIIAYYCGRMPTYNPVWCDDFTEGPILPIIIGYLGIAFWMRIATVLQPVIGNSKWINLLAENTYSIMMNQFLGFMLVKVIFALFCKYNLGFFDFDLNSFKTNIWYYYIPRNSHYSLTIYVVVGIVFSIIVQNILDYIKKFIYNLSVTQ